MNPKSPGTLSTVLILVWSILLITIFVIVTVPAEGPITNLLPDVFWEMRELIYPILYSPSLF